MSTDLEELDAIEVQQNRHGKRTNSRGKKIGQHFNFKRVTMQAKQIRSAGRKSRPPITLPHFSIQDIDNERS